MIKFVENTAMMIINVESTKMLLYNMYCNKYKQNLQALFKQSQTERKPCHENKSHKHNFR